MKETSGRSAVPGEPLHEALESVSKGTAVLVVAILTFLALSLLGRELVARALTVEDFGEFNLGVSFTTLLSLVSLLGLNQALARMLAWENDAGTRRTLIRWSIGVSAVLSVVGSAAVFFAAPALGDLFHNPESANVFRILAVSVGFGAITPVFAAIFQGFHNVVPNALFNQILNPLLFVIFAFLLIRADLGLTAALVAYVVADAVAFAGIVVYTWRRLPTLVPPGPGRPRRPPSALWVLTASLWGVSSLGYLTGYTDTIVLGVFRSAQAVGYYSTSITLSRVLLVAAQSLTYIYLPMTARLHRLGAYASLRSTYLTTTRWVLALTFPLFFMFFFAPDLTIRTLFGAKYEPAAFSLQILGLAAFASNLAGPVSACLGGVGMARTQLWTSGTSAVTNLALSLSLIPVLGIVGATVAWAIARMLYPGLGLAALHRSYGISPFRRALLLPLALTLLVGAPVFALAEALRAPDWTIVPLFFFGSGLYLFWLVASRSLLQGDLVPLSMVERVLRRQFPRLRRALENRIAPDPYGVPPSGSSAP